MICYPVGDSKLARHEYKSEVLMLAAGHVTGVGRRGIDTVLVGENSCETPTWKTRKEMGWILGTGGGLSWLSIVSSEALVSAVLNPLGFHC
jgi:hypothetical protein